MDRKRVHIWLAGTLGLTAIYPIAAALYTYGKGVFAAVMGGITYLMDVTSNGPSRIVVSTAFPEYKPDVDFRLMAAMSVFYFLYFGVLLSPLLARNKASRIKLFALSAVTVILCLVVSWNSKALF